MAKSEMNDLEKILSTYKLRPVKKSSVGFSKIASQVYRASVNQGFRLNVMIIGGKGLGKSTFLNNLFHTQFPKRTKVGPVTESPVFLITENGVNLRVKVIESPDFGENINNSQCWKSVENYINKCFEKQVQQEQKVTRRDRRGSEDHLVHICLYFVQPSSDDVCLRELDLEFLKSVHHKVNVVPLLAKADSMTSSEVLIHKTNLLKELQSNSIDFYKFSVPQDSGWRPEIGPGSRYYGDKAFIQGLIDRFPFAVAAGNEMTTVDNKLVSVRTYPWGSIQIDNLDHCDTVAVRTLVLSTHLQDLISETHIRKYEDFRSMFLEELCLNLGISQWNESHPALHLESYFKKVHISLEKKVEEMEQGFLELSARKEDVLLKKRKEVEAESVKMADEIQSLYSRFENDFAYFVADKTQWNCDNIDYHETCGTLKISKHGRIKPITLFRK